MTGNNGSEPLKRKDRQVSKTENIVRKDLNRMEEMKMTIQELLGEAYREGMTLEEINTALVDFEIPSNQGEEIEKLRRALSKSNKEAADYKKQLRDKLSADELKDAEEAEKRQKLQNDYDALLRRVSISENKARLLALGYEDALADETATAVVDDDLELDVANQKKHLDSVEKRVRAEVLKGTPRPTGDGGEGVSKEDILNIKDSYERQNAIAENIDLFE